MAPSAPGQRRPRGGRGLAAPNQRPPCGARALGRLKGPRPFVEREGAWPRPLWAGFTQSHAHSLLNTPSPPPSCGALISECRPLAPRLRPTAGGLPGPPPPPRRRRPRGPAAPGPPPGSPPSGAPGSNDVFVTSRSDFRAQLRRCQRLLAPGGAPGAPGELRLPGLGLAVPRTINLALQLQAGAGGTLRLHASTSSVPLRAPRAPAPAPAATPAARTATPPGTTPPSTSASAGRRPAPDGAPGGAPGVPRGWSRSPEVPGTRRAAERPPRPAGAGEDRMAP
ncbi:ribonuclease P protein subunit p20 [Lonchura striata]